MFRTTCLSACFSCLLLASQTQAKRVISAEISLLGGKVVLLGDTSDNGKADSGGVWRYLKRVTFGGGRAVTIMPDADNPLRATLEGKIRVSIDYGGQAEVSKLRMVRKKKTDFLWSIHPDDVEAMLKSQQKR